jgi:hypothetical protein
MKKTILINSSGVDRILQITNIKRMHVDKFLYDRYFPFIDD